MALQCCPYYFLANLGLGLAGWGCRLRLHICSRVGIRLHFFGQSLGLPGGQNHLYFSRNYPFLPENAWKIELVLFKLENRSSML
jgi:hypothetical protein